MEGTPKETHPNSSTRDKTNIRDETQLTNAEEHLIIPVQESQLISTQPIAEQEKLPEEVFKTCDSQTKQEDHETCRALSESKKKKNQALEKLEVPNNDVCTAAPDPVAESTLEAKPFNCSPSKSPAKQKWQPGSERWREKFKKLSSESEVIGVGSLMYVNKADFLIAKEKDGTKVFLGLRNDGTEVAIKKISKCNYQVLKNEEGFLRLPELDHPSILRYVDAAEDEKFGYLALQLCEYTLKEYVINTKANNDSGLLVKRLVYDILRGLMVLHHNHPPILHGDLKGQNILIDVNGRAKLADFSKSRYLVSGQTTYYNGNVETKYWMMAKETLEDENEIQNKLKFDIKMAGELIYYVHSGGHYPSGDTLDNVQDVVAMDLIEHMTNEDTQKRLKVEECLHHPYFWTTERREEYLRRVGNKKEVQKYKEADPELISSLKKYDRNGSLKQWKTKFPRELKKMESWKPYSDNAFGLLRYNRNLCEHHAEEKVNVMSLFPDLFGCVYKFAESQGWNSQPPLKDVFYFTTEETRGSTRDVMLTKNQEERLTVSVQESQHSFTQPARNEESECKRT